MKLIELYPTEDEMEKYMFEMTNMNWKVTGIPDVIIWASQAQDGAKKHGPRVKVSAHETQRANPNDLSVATSDLFVMAINDQTVVAGKSELPSQKFDDVADWVKLNQEALMKLWDGEVTGDEFFALLKPL